MSSSARNILGEFRAFENLEISSPEFAFFSKKMYELSGVFLPENEKNHALMKNRLARLLRKYNLSSYRDLQMQLNKATQEALNEFISCLTTNKTDFYREKSHFEFLSGKLKTHFEKNNELRIWCAAASTGQEPYTLAMVCSEILRPNELSRTKILATDIDLQALQKGADGFYGMNEMDGIPPGLESKYFEDFAGQYKVSESLTNMISFCPFNLVKGPYQFKQQFHFVFCRNVLIYFDEATCRAVTQNLVNSLVPEGHLFLGHSESGVIKTEDVTSLTGAIFKRKIK